MARDEFEDAVRWVAENLPLGGHTREEYASSYTARHVESYRHLVDTIRRHLPAGASILDFGAGLCDKSVLAQRAGYEVTAYDDFQNPVALDKGFRDGVAEFAGRAGVKVCVADGPLPFVSRTFDMVMMHGVIEHLHDSPRELLNDLVDRLKIGGLLFITVPSAVNVRKRIDVLRGHTNLPRFDTFYWYPGPWRGHVREYTKNDLALLCRFLGLERVELHGCHEMLSVVRPVLKPFYLAATSLFPGLRDSWCLVARKPAEWTAVREVPANDLDEILAHLNR